ncbi:hypothetical protein PUN28_004062 [Cardiocondyla obscurior]|uniref:Uncharacterized protein n=1 Tax=Cardiocondyla obscurior TaxID=286306 RepID=A0AAW2GNJ8_9HYME
MLGTLATIIRAIKITAGGRGARPRVQIGASEARRRSRGCAGQVPEEISGWRLLEASGSPYRGDVPSHPPCRATYRRRGSSPSVLRAEKPRRERAVHHARENKRKRKKKNIHMTPPHPRLGNILTVRRKHYARRDLPIERIDFVLSCRRTGRKSWRRIVDRERKRDGGEIEISGHAHFTC